MTNESDKIAKDARRAQRQQDVLLQEQMNADRAELEAKRQAVFNERLNIINAQKGQIWTPQGNYQPTMPKPSSPGKKPNLHYTSPIGR